MNIPSLFRFCPRCGRQSIQTPGGKCVRCSECGFLLFFNAGAAVGGIITDAQGQVLLLKRSRDPRKGKLGLPGGFVDPGESAEEALRREVREESNLEVAEMRYLCSFANRYEFQGVLYPTEDLFFVCGVVSLSPLAAMDEVESVCFVPPGQIREEEIAFPTVWQALSRYRRQTGP